MGDTSVLKRRGTDRSPVLEEQWRWGVHRGWAVRNLSWSWQVCAGERSLCNEVAPLGLLCAYRSRTMHQPVIIFSHWFFCPS